MKLKLDENLPRDLKAMLQAFDHDVVSAADEQLLSQPDTAVAAAARSEERMLLTLDVQFGDLRRYPPGSHPGIILFRPRSLGLLTVERFVEGFVRNADLRTLVGCLVVVDHLRTRVRWPSQGAGLSWK